MPDRRENSRERRVAIEGILRRERIHSQSELLRKLRQRGFRVTQPSVSRDLSELRAAKVEGRYLPGEDLAPGRAAASGLASVAEFILDGPRAAGPYLLVVKTPAGAAAQVALAIDRVRLPEIVGSVAGDDTLFIATAGRRAQAHVSAAIARLAREHADA